MRTRPGWRAALDALRKPDSYALIVPAPQPLSTNDLVKRPLVRMITCAGGQLLAWRARPTLCAPLKASDGLKGAYSRT